MPFVVVVVDVVVVYLFINNFIFNLPPLAISEQDHCSFILKIIVLKISRYKEPSDFVCFYLFLFIP